jgi:hypothetical protein
MYALLNQIPVTDSKTQLICIGSIRNHCASFWLISMNQSCRFVKIIQYDNWMPFVVPPKRSVESKLLPLLLHRVILLPDQSRSHTTHHHQLSPFVEPPFRSNPFTEGRMDANGATTSSSRASKLPSYFTGSSCRGSSTTSVFSA